MVRPGMRVLLPIVLAAGCVSPGSETPLVSANPFGTPPAVGPRTAASYAPAPTELAARVDLLGRRIVAANPQAGVQPVFRTIGAPQAEIFHNGTAEIDITSGLVQQCTTDGQLAAVLCHELGKMVSEREVLAGPTVRKPERRPPIDVPVGNDNAGSYGAADLTRQAELAKFDQDRRAAAEPLPPPDPDKLARIYLGRAQFTESELDQAAPLLRAAAANGTFEKQLTAPVPARPWTH